MRSTFPAFLGLILLFSTALALGLPSFAGQIYVIKAHLSSSTKVEHK